jgi:hypothetical protein
MLTVEEYDQTFMNIVHHICENKKITDSDKVNKIKELHKSFEQKIYRAQLKRERAITRYMTVLLKYKEI